MSLLTQVLTGPELEDLGLGPINCQQDTSANCWISVSHYFTLRAALSAAVLADLVLCIHLSILAWKNALQWYLPLCYGLSYAFFDFLLTRRVVAAWEDRPEQLSPSFSPPRRGNLIQKPSSINAWRCACFLHTGIARAALIYEILWMQYAYSQERYRVYSASLVIFIGAGVLPTIAQIAKGFLFVWGPTCRQPISEFAKWNLREFQNVLSTIAWFRRSRRQRLCQSQEIRLIDSETVWRRKISSLSTYSFPFTVFSVIASLSLQLTRQSARSGLGPMCHSAEAGKSYICAWTRFVSNLVRRRQRSEHSPIRSEYGDSRPMLDPAKKLTGVEMQSLSGGGSSSLDEDDEKRAADCYRICTDEGSPAAPPFPTASTLPTVGPIDLQRTEIDRSPTVDSQASVGRTSELSYATNARDTEEWVRKELRMIGWKEMGEYLQATLRSLAASEHKVRDLVFFTHFSSVSGLSDVLAENYLALDLREGVEYCRSFHALMHIHMLAAPLGLLKFHALMSPQSGNPHWTVLGSLVLGLFRAGLLFFMVSFDAQIFEELLDDEDDR